MKILFPIMLLGLVTLGSCTNETATDEIIEIKYSLSQNAQIEWKGIKSENYFHIGTINVKSGELTALDDSITGGKFTIDMLSIESTDLEEEKAQSLESHLMGLDSNEHQKPDDFFNAKVYPKVHVNVNGYDGESLNVDMEMMGQTIAKMIPVKIEISNEEVKITGTFEIDFDELKIPGLMPHPESGEQKKIELTMDLTMIKS